MSNSACGALLILQKNSLTFFSRTVSGIYWALQVSITVSELLSWPGCHQGSGERGAAVSAQSLFWGPSVRGLTALVSAILKPESSSSTSILKRNKEKSKKKEFTESYLPGGKLSQMVLPYLRVRTWYKRLYSFTKRCFIHLTGFWQPSRTNRTFHEYIFSRSVKLLSHGKSFHGHSAQPGWGAQVAFSDTCMQDACVHRPLKRRPLFPDPKHLGSRPHPTPTASTQYLRLMHVAVTTPNSQGRCFALKIRTPPQVTTYWPKLVPGPCLTTKGSKSSLHKVWKERSQWVKWLTTTS